MDPYIGELRLFAFNFAPVGWVQCNGQILNISQYAALFSILGTYYGGNGTSNFGLPNLQGAVPIGQGQGPGLSAIPLGALGGSIVTTLTLNEMPLHSHSLYGRAGPAAVSAPVSASMLAEGHGGVHPNVHTVFPYTTAQPPTTTLNPAAVGSTGGSQPHNNVQPMLAMNWCIALQGVFPTRN